MPLNNPSELDIKMTGATGGTGNNKINIWSKVVVPTQAIGFEIDYTEAGFTEVTNVQLTAQRDTVNAFDVPNIAIQKQPTSTKVAVNITQGSNNLVTVLNLSVLGGPAVIPAVNLSNIKIHIRVEGY